MSYNLFFKNRSPLQSLALIKKAKPDVLFVQELTPSWAATLAEALNKDYKYRKTVPLKGTHGIGIYSKYKLNNQRLLNNSSKKPYAQVVDAKIGDKDVQLINTHLASPAVAVENRERFLPLFLANYQVRKKQIAQLNKLGRAEKQNYNSQLLIGDLNTLQSEPIFKRLKSTWVNSGSAILRWTQFNFPNTNRIMPLMTLDYIMGRGQLKFLDYTVLEGGSSDHLAIMTTIKI